MGYENPVAWRSWQCGNEISSFKLLLNVKSVLSVITHMSLLVPLYGVLEQQTLENFTWAIRSVPECPAFCTLLAPGVVVHPWSYLMFLDSGPEFRYVCYFLGEKLVLLHSEFRDCNLETSLMSGLLVRPVKSLLWLLGWMMRNTCLSLGFLYRKTLAQKEEGYLCLKLEYLF